MAKTNPKDFQKTAATGVNSDVFDINIDEGATTGQMNDALRGMGGVMAAPCDWGDDPDAMLIDTIKGSTDPNKVVIAGLEIDNGTIPSIPTYTPPPGIMSPYGGDTAPALWLLCDGAAVSRTTYADLFASLGTKYGVGDGSTTFNLPDKRDKTSVGAGGTYAVGDTGGAATVTLTTPQIPLHGHPWLGKTANENQTASSGGDGPFITKPAGATGNITNPAFTGTPSNSAGQALGGTGGGAAHENMPPFEADNWIVFAGV